MTKSEIKVGDLMKLDHRKSTSGYKIHLIGMVIGIDRAYNQHMTSYRLFILYSNIESSSSGFLKAGQIKEKAFQRSDSDRDSVGWQLLEGERS